MVGFCLVVEGAKAFMLFYESYWSITKSEWPSTKRDIHIDISGQSPIHPGPVKWSAMNQLTELQSLGTLSIKVHKSLIRETTNLSAPAYRSTYTKTLKLFYLSPPPAPRKKEQIYVNENYLVVKGFFSLVWGWVSPVTCHLSLVSCHHSMQLQLI